MVVDVWNKSCKKNCEFYSNILCIVVSLRHTYNRVQISHVFGDTIARSKTKSLEGSTAFISVKTIELNAYLEPIHKSLRKFSRNLEFFSKKHLVESRYCLRKSFQPPLLTAKMHTILFLHTLQSSLHTYVVLHIYYILRYNVQIHAKTVLT